MTRKLRPVPLLKDAETVGRALMIVTKLEQWRSERTIRPAAPSTTKQQHVVEIECVHCHGHFFRWTATASAYGRCERCSTDH
jgi:hypothetical protein